jgi:hypothetical protein
MSACGVFYVPQGEAHAVLMELVNHPKFLGSNTREPIPWPAKRQGLRSVTSKDAGLPLFGNFYFEPWTDYPGYTNDPELKQHLDFTVGPDRKTSGAWNRSNEVCLELPCQSSCRVVVRDSNHSHLPVGEAGVRLLESTSAKGLLTSASLLSLRKLNCTVQCVLCRSWAAWCHSSTSTA